MSRRYPDGTLKKYQSFQLRLNIDVLEQLNLPHNHTRHHNDLSYLVNELLAGYVEALEDIKEHEEIFDA
ncbi:hypothetical protein [Pseudomonas sp.]|uniref:hypothetical protein n=1 Tax=Pseudomonas sp. TaxID=306 RepID=UPI004054733E